MTPTTYLTSVGDRISSGVKWAPGRSLWVGFYICSTYSSQGFLVLAVCPHTRTKRKLHTHLNPYTHVLRPCTGAIHKSVDNRVRDRKETFALFFCLWRHESCELVGNWAQWAQTGDGWRPLMKVHASWFMDARIFRSAVYYVPNIYSLLRSDI